MKRLKSRFTLIHFILLLGIVLRVYAAVSHIDSVHPDEHFQNLEPASHVVFGYGWMSWEWSVGLRSWFIPALYMPVLFIFKLLGFEGGIVPIIACRVLMALMNGWMLFRFDALLKKRELSLATRGISAVVYSLLPAFVAWGATTLSDNWAMISLWVAFPTILDELDSKNSRSWFQAGFLLGFSFLTRLQMLVWPAGIVLVLLLRKTSFKLLRSAFYGYGVVVLFQGVLDWITWGSPFQSVIMNVKKNIFENVAAFYGTSPFYDYFPQLLKNMSWGFWLLFAVVLGAACAARKIKLRTQDALILVPSFIYLLAHCIISHKENRFLLPIYPAIFYVFALATESAVVYANTWKIDFSKTKIALWFLVPGLAFASSREIYNADHYYPFDLGELMTLVRADGGLSSGRCLALVDHYFVWSHGELLQGRPVKYIEFSFNRGAPPPEFPSCIYAVTAGGAPESFISRAGGNWKLLATDSRGELLFKNQNP
jgi:GPI mannosyltransferase 3